MIALAKDAPNSPSRVPLRVELVTPLEERDELCRQLYAGGAHVDVVGYASSESEALRIYFCSAADVVILDARLVEVEPARLLGMFRRIAPNAFTVAVVPTRDCSAALAVAAVGADRIATPATLGLTLSELSRGIHS